LCIHLENFRKGKKQRGYQIQTRGKDNETMKPKKKNLSFFFFKINEGKKKNTHKNIHTQ
jgi:hypothetical protein